jgi:hypothetical protein
METLFVPGLEKCYVNELVVEANKRLEIAKERMEMLRLLLSI